MARGRSRCTTPGACVRVACVSAACGHSQGAGASALLSSRRRMFRMGWWGATTASSRGRALHGG